MSEHEGMKYDVPGAVEMAMLVLQDACNPTSGAAAAMKSIVSQEGMAYRTKMNKSMFNKVMGYADQAYVGLALLGYLSFEEPREVKIRSREYQRLQRRMLRGI